MNKNKRSFVSIIESYKISLEIAGKYANIFKKSLLLFVLSYVAQALAFVLFYPLLQNVLNKAFDVNQSLFWLGLIVLLGMISIILKWYAHHFDYKGDLVNVTHDIRLKLGDKIKKMPLQSLYKYRTGELNAILGSNVDESVLHMGVVAGMFLEVVVVTSVIIIATLFIDYRITLAILLALCIAVPIYIWKRKASVNERSDGAKCHALLESDMIEYIQGLTVLRAINQVGVNAKNLQKSIKEVREVQKKGVISSTLPMIVMSTLVEMIFLSVLAFGSIWIIQGSFTIAAMISLLIIVARLSEPISNFLAITGSIDIMSVAFRKIKEVLGVSKLKVKTPTKSPTAFNINFEHVCFSYNQDNHLALNNLSFAIKDHSLTAIVGNSGCGKTTLTKMIMRYADPQKGHINIGGVPITHMTQSELMSYISVVFQDVYLFDDTILNNIRMGNPKASDEEVMDAAKKAHCHEFVTRLPHGYETKVGDIGGSLSGGEKQRVSIARAILKDSSIVILDEPTSALDTQSEIVVQEALDALIKNKTVIVIAHRLSTICHADNILVLDQGELKEQGTHQELLLQQGKYYEMYQAQQRVKQWNIANE